MLSAALAVRCSCRHPPALTLALSRGISSRSTASGAATSLQHNDEGRQHVIPSQALFRATAPFHPVALSPIVSLRSFSSSPRLASAAAVTSTATVTETVSQVAATVIETKATVSTPPMASDGKEELVLSALIPDRPSAVSQLASEGGEHIAANLEPTFESLGLASWMPSGRVQYFLEWMHVTGDIPWWGCIIIGTKPDQVLGFSRCSHCVCFFV